jgi:hypothetical protein
MTEKTEKAFTDLSDDAHDGKSTHQDLKHEVPEEAGRRQSVAFNIVENPLKVSFAMF